MIQGVGPVTARELLEMPADDWGIIRDRITDFASGKVDGRVARCMMCEGRVFIQTRAKGGQKLPYFAHYKGGDPNCRWFHGKTMPPDAARADQYQGRQESPAHRMLCQQIDELVRLDARYITSTVGQYHKPADGTHGRYPDVYVEWRGLQPFAIELQLSNTFQTEVSGRGVYYERQGVALIWVLYGLDFQNGDIAQSFRDVIRRHRGNAFTIDREAVQASREQKTLVLKCHLKNAREEYDPPTLVRLDQLHVPKKGLAFFEDRITAALQERIDARRKPWFAALQPLRKGWNTVSIKSEEITAALDGLKRTMPVLSTVHSPGDDERYEILRLIAVAFSIISTANNKERNYASRHENIKAMLNTFLNAGSGIQMYALIVERLLRMTTLHGLLTGTVGTHLERAKKMAEGNLCLDFEPEWEIMRYLVPEVFDPVIRDELEYLDALPAWSVLDAKIEEYDDSAAR